MRKRDIIIKVGNDRIYFNPEHSISIDKTSIPKKFLRFKTQTDIFWTVEMLDYTSGTNCLRVKVINYHAKNISLFEDQQPKKKIEQLLFERLDWLQLKPLLTFHQESKLKDILYNTEDNSYTNDNDELLRRFEEDRYQLDKNKIVITNKENFRISFSEVEFGLGYVSFKKSIKNIGLLDFKIPNEHILAEFDHIKLWFAKALKKKKLNVTVYIELNDNEVVETKALSKDIDKITPELIDSVKYQRTLALTKEPKNTDSKKALFTAGEIFSQFNTDNIEGNVFQQTEEDILNILIQKKGIRNEKHLAYLSEKKQSENHKLRYTLKPNFGFLFLIEGADDNHFVWELLNSHATYIWSIAKSEMEIESQFKKVEESVNTVRTIGRNKYKKTSNPQEKRLVFRVIQHDSLNANFEEGFPAWKSKLNEQLI